MTWEYSTITFGPVWDGKIKDIDKLRELLARMGAERWELVSALDTILMGNSVEIVLIFKRPK
jgi:hypothetical protein